MANSNRLLAKETNRLLYIAKVIPNKIARNNALKTVTKRAIINANHKSIR